jgi:hypothetical protein
MASDKLSAPDCYATYCGGRACLWIGQSLAHGFFTRESVGDMGLEGTAMDDNDHPRGALAFILVYLLLVVFLWTHVYLRLWVKG